MSFWFSHCYLCPLPPLQIPLYTVFPITYDDNSDLMCCLVQTFENINTILPLTAHIHPTANLAFSHFSLCFVLSFTTSLNPATTHCLLCYGAFWRNYSLASSVSRAFYFCAPFKIQLQRVIILLQKPQYPFALGMNTKSSSWHRNCSCSATCVWPQFLIMSPHQFSCNCIPPF